MILKYKIKITTNKDLYHYNQYKAMGGSLSGLSAGYENYAAAHTDKRNAIRSGDLTLTRLTHWKTWVTTTQSARELDDENIVIDQGTDEYYGRMGYASAMTIAGGDDPIKPQAQSGGGARQIMGGALMLGAVTSEVPPAAAIIIAGGAIAASAVYFYYKIAGKGNAGYPGPWTYTYQHPSQNPINNPMKGFDPKEPPQWGGAAKLLIGGKLIYEMYDEYNNHMNNLAPIKPAIRDNTNVYTQYLQYKRR